jgi:hypothetical protein
MMRYLAKVSMLNQKQDSEKTAFATLQKLYLGGITGRIASSSQALIACLLIYVLGI